MLWRGAANGVSVFFNGCENLFWISKPSDEWYFEGFEPSNTGTKHPLEPELISELLIFEARKKRRKRLLNHARCNKITALVVANMNNLENKFFELASFPNATEPLFEQRRAFPMYTHTYTFTYTQAYAYTHTHIHTCTHTHIHTYTYTHVHTYTYI